MTEVYSGKFLVAFNT